MGILIVGDVADIYANYVGLWWGECQLKYDADTGTLDPLEHQTLTKIGLSKVCATSGST